MYLIISVFLLFIQLSLHAFEPAIILVGPPGSGKGSLSQYLKINHGFNHISIGDMLRNEVEKETELGLAIKDKIKQGEYIDPKVILEILEKVVGDNRLMGKSFILDGFGQNDGEIQEMNRIFEKHELLDKVIVICLVCDDANCRARITNRLICSNCGYVYNLLTFTPIVPETCDLCCAALQKRLNDTPKVIIKRIENYREFIQRKHSSACDLFPSVIIDTNRPLDECIQSYQQLVEFIDSIPSNKYLNLSEFTEFCKPVY